MQENNRIEALCRVERGHRPEQHGRKVIAGQRAVANTREEPRGSGVGFCSGSRLWVDAFSSPTSLSFDTKRQRRECVYP